MQITDWMQSDSHFEVLDTLRIPGLRIDHVGIAVHSIRDALPIYAGLFGGVASSGGDNSTGEIRNVQISYPSGVKLELLQPVDDRGSLAAFLDTRGPGLHHVTVMVPHLETAIAQIKKLGLEVTETDLTNSHWMATYVRPKSSFGVLIQVVQTDIDWTAATDGLCFRDIVEGKVHWDEEIQKRLDLIDGIRSDKLRVSD